MPLLAIGAIALAGLAFAMRPMFANARVGAAYGARTACACRYIAGRPLSECRKDFEPGMQLMMLSDDAEARRITVRYPLLLAEHASYRPGWGCQLEPWHD